MRVERHFFMVLAPIIICCFFGLRTGQSQSAAEYYDTNFLNFAIFRLLPYYNPNAASKAVMTNTYSFGDISEDQYNFLNQLYQDRIIVPAVKSKNVVQLQPDSYLGENDLRDVVLSLERQQQNDEIVYLVLKKQQFDERIKVQQQHLVLFDANNPVISWDPLSLESLEQ